MFCLMWALDMRVLKLGFEPTECNARRVVSVMG